MKKFMKAIAFVTVMCMALSTVAFAAAPVTNGVDSAEAGTDKKITVTVDGADVDEQVALVLVSGEVTSTAGITQSNIEYIDQKSAGSAGSAVFGPITTKTTPDKVSIFVGYEGAVKNYVGTVTLKEAITKVTISNVETEIVRADGKQQIGAGAAIKFNIEAPADVYAEKMIWAIRYLEGGVEKVKYTDAMDVSGYGIGTLMTGSVELGLAFLNGFTVKGEEIIKEYVITDVDVIFMFSDDEEILTNPEGDSGNEK